MNLKRTTDIQQLKAQLPGVGIELDREGETVKRVRFLSEQGSITIFSDYGTSLLVPAPPKKEVRFQLTGKHKTLPEFREEFEHRHEAESRLREIERDLGYPEDHEIAISETEVEIPA